MKINRYIDHTLLKPVATPEQIIRLCEEARRYDFFSVCVNSSYVTLAASCLEDSDVKVCTVIGFPLGAMSTAGKMFEAVNAIEQGADEIDMVIHIGHLKAGNDDYVKTDIMAVKEAIGDKTLKVILETSELTGLEIAKGTLLSVISGADFIKTSTGFASGGASPEAVQIMKQAAQGKAKIKASGGIRDAETARKYIEMGVDRLGVSAGVAIMEGSVSGESY